MGCRSEWRYFRPPELSQFWCQIDEKPPECGSNKCDDYDCGYVST